MNERLKQKSMQVSGIESDIALKFIAFLVSDEERLQHFCALSGMGEPDLTAGLTDTVMQGFNDAVKKATDAVPVKVINTEGTQHTIEGLTAGATVEITVTGVNDAGEGQPSAPVQVVVG